MSDGLNDALSFLRRSDDDDATLPYEVDLSSWLEDFKQGQKKDRAKSCTCGGTKTYGENANAACHAPYCDWHKGAF